MRFLIASLALAVVLFVAAHLVHSFTLFLVVDAVAVLIYGRVLDRFDNGMRIRRPEPHD